MELHHLMPYIHLINSSARFDSSAGTDILPHELLVIPPDLPCHVRARYTFFAIRQVTTEQYIFFFLFYLEEGGSTRKKIKHINTLQTNKQTKNRCLSYI